MRGGEEHHTTAQTFGAELMSANALSRHLARWSGNVGPRFQIAQSLTHWARLLNGLGGFASARVFRRPRWRASVLRRRVDGSRLAPRDVHPPNRRDSAKGGCSYGSV